MTRQNLSFSPTRRDSLIAVFLVLFAFVLRCIVVFERAYHDPAFFTLPAGTDQAVYVSFARGWQAGTWPNAPFHHQPGLVYFLILIRSFTGDSLGTMRLATSLLGALACGVLIAVGWQITGKRWGGFLAGLLLAIYPPAIFYATVLLDVNLSVFLVCLVLLLALWQQDRLAGLKVWRSLLIGAAVGYLAITRLNLAVLLLAWLVFLWLLRPGWRKFALHSALSIVALAAVIAPVTLWNLSQGRAQLISETGTKEVYRGSNRDANGIRVSNDLATAITPHEDYLPMLLFDIGRDPRRFVELQLRKIGLFFSPSEPANNIDYIANGEDASLLLRLIPLDFRVIALPGLVGVGALLLYGAERRKGWLLLLTTLLILAGVLLTWYAARLRLPVVVPLILGVSALLVDLVETLRAKLAWGQMARRYAPSLLAVVLLCAGGDWAIDHLPTKTTLSALPGDAIPTELVFDDTLRLVGWRALSVWPAAKTGWSATGGEYAVELFWQITQPTAYAYNASVAYVVNGERVAGYDWEIGDVAYPRTPTSTWQQGAILSEIVGFSISRDLPREISGDLRVSVYRVEGEFRPGEPDTRQVFPVVITSLPEQPTSIALHPLAVVDYPQSPARRRLPEDYTASEAVFGEQIALLGYAYQLEGDQLRLAFHWATLPNVEIRRDAVQFIHVEDSAGALVGQLDLPPRAGSFLTSTWPPDYGIHDEVILAILSLQTSTAPYRVYTGLYDSVTMERLPVNTPDNRLFLFEFNP